MAVNEVLQRYLQYTSHLEHATQWALHACIVASLAATVWVLTRLSNTFLVSAIRLPLPPGPQGKWFTPGPR